MCKIVNNFYPPAQSNRHDFPTAGATRRVRELSVYHRKTIIICFKHNTLIFIQQII